MGPAVLTAENCPLGKYRQAVQADRSGAANGGIGQDPIVEGHVDAVVIPVESHRLHIHVSIQKIRTADLDPGTAVQHRLGTPGQIDPQVFDAVFIPAAVGDLSGVDGKRLAQVFTAALQTALAIVTHGDTSCSILSVIAYKTVYARRQTLCRRMEKSRTDRSCFCLFEDIFGFAVVMLARFEDWLRPLGMIHSVGVILGLQGHAASADVGHRVLTGLTA